MPPRLLVIGLVPPTDFARFLGDLRIRYPEAAITALIGNPELCSVQPQADEYLLWNESPPRELAAELRRRRFALSVLAFNPEYCYTLTYWKALLLTAVSRTRGVLLCRHGRLPETAPSLSEAWGARVKLAARWVPTVCLHLALLAAILLFHLMFLLFGALLLLPLLGLIAVDAGVAVARLFGPPRRNQA
jgi:hypothetical protein